MTWRDLRSSPLVHAVLSGLGFGTLLGIVALLMQVLPLPFNWLLWTYGLVVLMGGLVGVLLMARWWLVWIVTTLIWTACLLAVRVWQLAQLSP
jgi:hypothetical protein